MKLIIKDPVGLKCPAAFRKRLAWLVALCVTILTVTAPCVHATSSDDLDVGAPNQAGGTTFAGGVYTITGGGATIGGTSDHFHFNKGTLTGNGSVTAFVKTVTNTNQNAECGVMLRSTSAANSAEAGVFVTPGNGLWFLSRAKAGGATAATRVGAVSLPVWVKISRAGSSFTGSYSTDGSKWVQVSPAQTITMPQAILAGVAVTASNSSALCTGTLTHIAVTPDVDSRYLHAQGNQVCDMNGNVIPLRGVDIGGWLLTEHWMTGVQFDTAANAAAYDRYLVQYLEQRFGAAQAAPLISAWYDNWFRDVDLDNIKSYGFSVIRVPFSWRVLQDANGNWYRDDTGNIDFSRFDWVVQEAAKRGIYVIFDLHDWNGRFQNSDDILSVGSTGDTERTEAAQIWSALAQHFKGCGTIAAFDMINEPDDCNDNTAAYQAFYQAIRSQDSSRLIVAESVNPARFADLGWSNIMSSYHYIVQDQPSLTSYLATPGLDPYTSPQYPAFIGEFKANDSGQLQQAATNVTEGMDQEGWAWATWTYKAVNEGGWAMLNYDSTVNVNIDEDSAAAILAAWTTGLQQTSHLYPTTDLIAGLEQGAAYAPPPLVSGRTYEIRNVNSGLLVNTGSGSQGTQAQQSGGIDPANATGKWLATQQSDGTWTFANAAGLILDDAGAGTANGTPVIQWTAGAGGTGVNNQRWRITPVGDGTYNIVNSSSGLSMEVAAGSSASGAVIDLSTNTSGASYQHWTFVDVFPANAPFPLVSGGTYILSNFNSGRCMDTYADPSSSQGQQVYQYQGLNPANGRDLWLATQLSDGNWTFANAAGLLLDDAGAGTSNGTPVIQWPQSGGLNQEWHITPVGNGTSKITNASSDLDMEVYGGSIAQGGAIEQWSDDTPLQPWQCWGFSLVP